MSIMKTQQIIIYLIIQKILDSPHKVNKCRSNDLNGMYTDIQSLTYLVFFNNVGGVILNRFCYSKINELQLSSYQHEVSWFQVRVHNTFIMDSPHSFQYLL
jgi:virulence-associated protein VapD